VKQARHGNNGLQLNMSFESAPSDYIKFRMHHVVEDNSDRQIQHLAQATEQIPFPSAALVSLELV